MDDSQNPLVYVPRTTGGVRDFSLELSHIYKGSYPLLSITPNILKDESEFIYKWHGSLSSALVLIVHEPWNGVLYQDYKSRILGLKEKILLKRTVKTLKPCCMITSTDIYVNIMAEHFKRIPIIKLPVFDNISGVDLRMPLKTSSTKWVKKYSNNRIIIFGALHPMNGLRFLHEFWNEFGMNAKVHLVGSACKSYDLLVQYFGDRAIVNHGYLNREVLTKMIREYSYGMIVMPREVLEKSGSAQFLVNNLDKVFLYDNLRDTISVIKGSQLENEASKISLSPMSSNKYVKLLNDALENI